MPTETDLKLSLCWYDKEQWELLAQIDPDGVDDTYEEWRKSANEAISHIEANGQSVEKISINILELQKWCREKNVEPNSDARAEFAAMLSRKMHEKQT